MNYTVTQTKLSLIFPTNSYYSLLACTSLMNSSSHLYHTTMYSFLQPCFVCS